MNKLELREVLMDKVESSLRKEIMALAMAYLSANIPPSLTKEMVVVTVAFLLENRRIMLVEKGE